jgi:hypothetical protein
MPSIWDRVASRTRSLFTEGLRAAGTPLSPGFSNELVEILIAADFGPALAERMADALRRRKPPAPRWRRS